MSPRRWMLLSLNTVLACMLAYVVTPTSQPGAAPVAERSAEAIQPLTRPAAAPQRIAETRPLFQSAAAQAVEEPPPTGAPVAPEFTVVGIAAGQEQALVLIRTEDGNTIRLRQNEAFEGWMVAHLTGKDVTFANGAATATLRLYEQKPEP